MDFGLRGLGDRIAERAALAGRRTVLFVLGGLCFLAMIGFLAAALYTWLDRTWGVYIAEFGLAAVFLVVGLILTLIGAMTGRKKPQPALDPLAGLSGSTTESIAPLVALVTAFAVGLVRGLRKQR